MTRNGAHYNPDDFAKLQPVEDTHFWFVSRNDILTAVVASVAGDVDETGAVLEIGCGTGNTLRALRRALPRATIVGLDAYHEGLLHAKDRAAAAVVEGRIEHMPFRKPFAMVGMFDVLEHLEDDLAALKSVNGSLEPGGRAIITVPAEPSLWSRFDEESHHQRRYTKAQLRDVLVRAGFHVEYVSHFMSITYPALWASRRFDRLRTSRASERADSRSVIEREIRILPPVNWLFRQLLRFEVPLVRRRFHLPVGTSLLAIARS